MGKRKPYRAEFTLIVATMIIGLLGFWNVYLGPRADPQPHHHLHVLTTFLWMGLLLFQLQLLPRGQRLLHRHFGLAVLFAGPLLVASAALLAVHSAHGALVAGEDDALIVHNILGTLWLALILLLAFLFRKRRKLHGALMCSTLVLFLAPALMFALIAWAPPFRIEGPETFYRFQTAGMTGQAIILATVVAMFLRDRRNNWAYLLAFSANVLAEGLRALLQRVELIDALIAAVGSLNPGWTFAASFLLLFVALAAILRDNIRQMMSGAPATAQAGLAGGA